MLKFIDDFLNSITMYRLVLYYLIFLLAVAFGLSALGFLSYDPLSLLMTTLFLLSLCWLVNWIFSYVFESQTNFESIYISALILALIITPIRSFHDLAFLGWVSVWVAASKFIFAYHKKHLFNPVALAVALTSLGIYNSASWWVGTAWMMPFVLAGGLLVVRKIRRFSMVLTFLGVALAVISVFGFIKGTDLPTTLKKSLLDSPVLFFAFIMLTEPLTTPPTRKLQLLYGGLVGFLFAPQMHIGSVYSTPELSLIAGNIFSFIVSPKFKLILKLSDKIKIAPDVYDFIFSSNQKPAYLPGQYMEWTLNVKNIDSRGNRRYFTLASSPTENNLRLGVKFYETTSSFKKELSVMSKGSEIMAGQLAGDFVLPKDRSKKLVFIAGGIGVTPFRSMIKYMLDSGDKRQVVLLYSNKTVSDVVYKDVFDQALGFGLKTVYMLTNETKLPEGWKGRIGFIDENVIKEEIPDYKERMFYISGPRSMIVAFENTLRKMGLGWDQIKTDYFPGFA